ncbi:hypothetical protein RHSIM_RhsimUnG0107200 [Rhododendron simsii]|uniref:Aminotransferase-like plant mobile domain-containing protein n=1 Tax=Rhododendron simsii TaxID=118357 RepID=A0A834L2K5_RHOSS|nr:hypothetical protein RHSIM_RhsimUnG0107200 [Rhododendron simsii]
MEESPKQPENEEERESEIIEGEHNEEEREPQHNSLGVVGTAAIPEHPPRRQRFVEICRTRTFSLGGKKYIISLEDVACLTGLSVNEQAIIWKENKDIYTLCENVLGRKVLLYFPTIQDRMCLEFISLLKDFEGIRRLSWGSSMLALLIENLKKDPSKSDDVNLGGNATLLQFWVHLRFPAFRPNEMSMENMSVPLMVKWSKEISKQSKNAYQKAPLDQWETITNSPTIEDHATVEDGEQSRVRKQRRVRKRGMEPARVGVRDPYNPRNETCKDPVHLLSPVPFPAFSLFSAFSLSTVPHPPRSHDPK